MRILGAALGTLAVSVVAFFLALQVHFPGTAARDRLAYEVQSASGGAWLLQAADAHLYRGTGLTLDDVVIFKVDTSRRRSDETDGPAAIPLARVEEASARFKLLPLIRGQKAVAFALDLYGGDLSGDLDLTDATQRLRVDGQDIDLSRVPLEGAEWVVDATGMLAVKGDISLDLENIKDSKGELRLDVTDLVFQQATIMGMTLEPTPFTESSLALKINKGQAEVVEGHFASEPVEITVTGEIVLNKTLARSRLKLKLDVHFSDQFDRLAKLAPGLSLARDEDGIYHFRVTGTLQNPRFRADRIGRRGSDVSAPKLGGRSPLGGRDRANLNANLSGKRKLGTDDGGLRGDGGSADDAEARRAERRDRIRERRQRMMDRRDEGADGDQPGLPPMPGQLGGPPQELGVPGRIDRRRFTDGEDLLDVNIRDDGQGPEYDGPPEDLPPFNEGDLPDPRFEEQQFNDQQFNDQQFNDQQFNDQQLDDY